MVPQQQLVSISAAANHCTAGLHKSAAGPCSCYCHCCPPCSLHDSGWPMELRDQRNHVCWHRHGWHQGKVRGRLRQHVRLWRQQSRGRVGGRVQERPAALQHACASLCRSAVSHQVNLTSSGQRRVFHPLACTCLKTQLGSAPAYGLNACSLHVYLCAAVCGCDLHSLP